MSRIYLILFLTVLSLNIWADVPLFDFENNAPVWQPECFYGKVSKSNASVVKNGGENALCISYIFESPYLNHIIFATERNMDMSSFGSLKFDIRGNGDKVNNVILHLWDDKGRRSIYGPGKTNNDFNTDYPEWHTLTLSFDNDVPQSDGQVDLSHIVKIGIMLLDNGQKNGKVFIDNIRGVIGDEKVVFSPHVISPNGDGVYDFLKIKTRLYKDSSVTIKVKDSNLKTVAVPFVNCKPKSGELLEWNGRDNEGKNLPDGKYTILAMINDDKKVFSQTVEIDTSHSWPALKYDKMEPFFPIGTWFDVHQTMSSAAGKDSKDIGAYYDSCFADMASLGINTAVVPSCPPEYREILLKSAERHNIKIIIDPYTAHLIMQLEPIRESEVYDYLKPSIENMKKQKALLGYYIVDEPHARSQENWNVLKRIFSSIDSQHKPFVTFNDFSTLRSFANLDAEAQGSQYIAMDDYAHCMKGEPNLDRYVGNLQSYRDIADKCPLWMVIGTFNIENAYRYPTPEELRAVTYMSLATGAKGIFYFLYRGISRPDGLTMEGIVQKDGKKSALYFTVRQLGHELQLLSPLLLTLKRSDFDGKVTGNITVGRFLDSSGRNVIIIANNRADSITIAEIECQPDKKQWEDVLDKKIFQTFQNNLEIKLSPGEGRVLIAK